MEDPNELLAEEKSGQDEVVSLVDQRKEVMDLLVGQFVKHAESG